MNTERVEKHTRGEEDADAACAELSESGTNAGGVIEWHSLFCYDNSVQGYRLTRYSNAYRHRRS
jgi:hypothetical protein